jgi:peptidoglycan/LPS O-acetylase OafA/YrhL
VSDKLETWKTGKGRIPSLDGLRAISIMLVVVGHLSERFPKFGSVYDAALAVLSYAGLGVSIFFVISGFLITGLLLTEVERKGNISLPDFYLRRAFRIFPAYYVFLGVLLVLWATMKIAPTSWDMLSAALYILNYANARPAWWVGHTWSLCIEEQFYLLWPVSLMLLKKDRARWLALLLVVAAPLLRIGTYFLLPDFRGRIGGMLHTRVDMLMFGCLLAIFYQHPACARIYRKVFQYKGHLVAAVFLFLISPLLVKRYGGAYALTLGWTLEGLGITTIIYWCVQSPLSFVGRLLNSALFVHVGLISYSLYLWQQLFTNPESTFILTVFPFNLICIWVMAELSYYLIEKPFLRWRVQLSQRRRARLDERNGGLRRRADSLKAASD